MVPVGCHLFELQSENPSDNIQFRLTLMQTRQKFQREKVQHNEMVSANLMDIGLML